MLAAVTDQRVEPGGDGPPAGEASADYGFPNALQEPEQYGKATTPTRSPGRPGQGPRGSAQSRAPRASRRREVVVRLWCPPRWPAPVEPICRGVARVTGAGRRRRYAVAAGSARLLRFRLKQGRLRALRRKRTLPVEIAARNADAAAGTATRLASTLRRPKRPR